MLRVFALAALILPLSPARPPPFRASAEPLSPRVQTMLVDGGIWRRGCPVALSDLRVLTVTYRGFDRRAHDGRLVVNAGAAQPLAGVFRRLYGLRFPIRHLSLADAYGPLRDQPRDGDVSGSFSCRQAVPSPCTGGTGTGTWSMHAFGLAVDVNPRENPYVGCGESHDPAARRYRDRSLHRRGMITTRVIRAFGAAGWGWGGAWVGDTHDFMHFSSTGH